MLGWLVAKSLPLVPRRVVGAVARRYIAGETRDDAMATVRALNARGFAATVDVLGEEVTTAEGARAATDEYVALLDALNAAQVHAGVSLKLSQLGARFDLALCRELLQRVVDAASDRFVRLDMEDATLTETTLTVYRELRGQSTRVGAVLQAYLRRTADDVEALLAEATGTDVRICKGIYKEKRSIAFHDAAEINASYLRLALRLLEGGARVAFATHDRALIDGLREHVVARGVPRDRYEFQALLGVPIEGVLDGLVAEGHRVRVYVPYGADWFAYSTRRLRENPDMAGHVLKALVRRLD